MNKTETIVVRIDPDQKAYLSRLAQSRGLAGTSKTLRVVLDEHKSLNGDDEMIESKYEEEIGEWVARVSTLPSLGEFFGDTQAVAERRAREALAFYLKHAKKHASEWSIEGL